MKEFKFVYNTEKNKWYRVNFIKYVKYNDKFTDEILLSVHLDTDQFTFVLPNRHKIWVLEAVFGLDEKGQEVPEEKRSAISKKFKKHQCLHYACFAGLEFRVKEEQTAEEKFIREIEFRSVLFYDKSSQPEFFNDEEK